MFEKVLAFAKDGKGRRLMNTLNRRDVVLSPDELDEVLKVYQQEGLPAEVALLKKRRGILNDAQYDALAETVGRHCHAAQYEAFAVALRDLLSCGIKMNPAKMERDEPD